MSVDFSGDPVVDQNVDELPPLIKMVWLAGLNGPGCATSNT